MNHGAKYIFAFLDTALLKSYLRKPEAHLTLPKMMGLQHCTLQPLMVMEKLLRYCWGR